MLSWMLSRFSGTHGSHGQSPDVEGDILDERVLKFACEHIISAETGPSWFLVLSYSYHYFTFSELEYMR